MFPNITEATQKFVGIGWYTNSGVISFDDEVTAAQIAQGSNTSYSYRSIYFNAGKQKAIYSNSITTVQPKSLNVQYLIKY